MADKSNATARHGLTVDTLPQQIPRDMTGPDNPIPLSPQWLLPKPGDNKLGMFAGDSHLSPHHGNHIDAVKASGNLEELHNGEKQRDASWPSFHDESVHHDRWRDEERETNSVRRDRWREGDRDKETTNSRRERWMDSSFGHSGEARRAASDRWNDSGNRDNTFEQRRESKWNTRWGPDDKESDVWREKKIDPVRDDEGSRDKGVPHQANMEREGEHYSRPWRPNSSQTRRRGDSSLTPGKQGQMFGYGRGRVGNGSSVFSAGRGRVTMSLNNNGSTAHFHPLGLFIDKPTGVHDDSSALRYSRTKLLDIYRMMDVKSCRKLLEGSIEVPSLTQTEPSEPLALTAPTSEELAVLKDIDKGDIISSGTSQVTKDGLVGQNPVDTVTLRHAKLGSREDLSSAVGDSKDDMSGRLIKGHPLGYHDYVSCEKHLHQSGTDLKVDPSQNLHSHQDRILNIEVLRTEGANLRKGDETAVRESVLERPSSQHAIPWRSQSMGECSRVASDDWQDFSSDVRPRTSDLGWPHSQKNEEAKRMCTIAIPTPFLTNEGFQSEMSRDLKFKRQASEVLDWEKGTHVMLGHEDSIVSSDNTRKFLLQSSPEDLLLHYKDPQGQIQGPFSGSDLIGWFEAGYFGIDLQVRLADAPPDAPFSLLGDVMPHLRMKARPPPGFGAHNQIEAVNGSVAGKLVGQGNIHVGFGDLEHIKSGPGKRQESAAEAGNRFLESLMSRNMGSSVGSFSFSESAKGYASSGSAGMSAFGGEPGNDPNYLLAQRMPLEHHQSLPNHLPFWVGKDPASMPSKPEPVLDSPAQYSTLLPPMADTPHLSAHVPQHVDLLSILKAAADKASPPAVNSSLAAWLNVPDAQCQINNTMHSGMGAIKNNIDVHHNQHFTSQAVYGVQPQHLQQSNQSSLSHTIPHPTDNPSNFVSPEKVLSSAISQDPHMLNMLQQQLLLSQLQLQSQMPIPSQLFLLDKILLMKEQQKQEQQQQQLLLQQQHMLSQILSERQSQRHTGEAPYGLLQVAGSPGNAPSNHLSLQHSPEVFQINTQMQALNLQDGRAPNVSNLPTQDVVPMSPPLPQHTMSLEGQATLPEHFQHVPSSDSVLTVPTTDNTSSAVVIEKSSQEVVLQQESAVDLRTDASHQGIEMVVVVASEEVQCSVTSDGKPDTSEQASSQQVNDMKIPSEYIFEQSPSESSVVKDVKQLEDREVKKPSEKKSKRQKNLKSQSTLDKLKGSSKSVNCEQSKLDPEIEVASTATTESVIRSGEKESRSGTSLKLTNAESVVDTEERPISQQVHLSSTKHVRGDNSETFTSKTEEVECASQSKMQTPAQRAWKPAPCLKAKSLLEIQQEEQKRTDVEMFTSDIAASCTLASGFSSVPWSGVVANSDLKSNRDTVHDGVNAEFVQGSSGDNLNSRCMKSQLHELLAEVSNELNEDVADTAADRSFLVSHPMDTKVQTDSATCDDGDFIQAKDMKKSRKKAAKAKAAAVKNPTTVSSADPVPLVPAEKNKSARQSQQEKEPSSVLPPGLSLGDFVLWKDDESNSSPTPAWSTDSLRVQKPSSLRDILKEQEKKAVSVQKQIPIVASARMQQNRNCQGTSSLWQSPRSSPSKAVSPIKNNSLFSPAKSKIEDDLFWGPLNHPKQESKPLDFPSLATSCSWGTKVTPSKNASVVASVRPKPSGRAYPLSSSPAGQLSLKGRGDAMSKHSEAMDFRDWCEGELVRLTGSRDTGFLEFCLKQSTVEAETLLRENLGSLDPQHEFIDKFLNYKELLAADVLEIALQSHHAGDSRAYGNVDIAADNNDADTLTGPDGSEKKGGTARKKGKKGKKVNLSALGFNVVSNRIMMGEIQSVED